LGSELAWQPAQRQAAPEHQEQRDALAQARQAAAPQRALPQEPDWEPVLQPGQARVEMEQQLPALAQQEEAAEPMVEQEQRAQQWKPRAQEPAAQQQAAPVTQRA